MTDELTYEPCPECARRAKDARRERELAELRATIHASGAKQETDRCVFRYEVPVDDHWHTLMLSGRVLHVAARQLGVVELWALESGGPRVGRVFRVVGTGHPWPVGFGATYVGTALVERSPLVWHLLEADPLAGIHRRPGASEE